MIVTGNVAYIHQSLDGQLQITLNINEKSKALEELADIKDEKVIDIALKKHGYGRSLNANAYMWQLLNKIAVMIGSEKEDVYLLELTKHGPFVDMEVRAEAADSVRKMFRYVEVLAEENGCAELRCYYGSHLYDSKEMSVLIDDVVEDCKTLGIETLPEDEISHMVSLWKGEK